VVLLLTDITYPCQGRRQGGSAGGPCLPNRWLCRFLTEKLALLGRSTVVIALFSKVTLFSLPEFWMRRLKKVVNIFKKSAPSQLLCPPQCKILATRLICVHNVCHLCKLEEHQLFASGNIGVDLQHSLRRSWDRSWFVAGQGLRAHYKLAIPGSRASRYPKWKI